MQKILFTLLITILFTSCNDTTPPNSTTHAKEKPTKVEPKDSVQDDGSSIVDDISDFFSSDEDTSSSEDQGGFFDGAIEAVSDFFADDQNTDYVEPSNDQSWYDYFFGSSENTQVIDNSASLLKELNTTALEYENDKDGFILKGLDLTVAYVTKEYFPDFMGEYILGLEFLKGSELVSNETLYGYMSDIYDEAYSSTTVNTDSNATNTDANTTSADTNSTNMAPALNANETSLIQRIIDEIYNMIYEFLFGSNDNADVNLSDGATYKIDPNQTFEFTQDDINGKKYYVASEQYMEVTFSSDGATGRGEIGFGVGADFTSYISGGKLFIDMDGVYEVEMLYKDKDYCTVNEMLDTSSGDKYLAFFFTNEETYKKASNVKVAKSLCYIHSSEYEEPVIAKDGVLEPIKDERAGHKVVVADTTSQIVDQLVSGVDRQAGVIDAKYFGRKLRHGVFSIYTTNEQTHTLQATENEKISRELLPLVASSAINLQNIMDGAYNLTLNFQDDVNKDLNSSFTEINSRLDELVTATSVAMDRTTSNNGYHGVSDTTAFGDIVEFEASNIKSTCGILFFACNSAEADVTMTISNPSANSKNADIKFQTHIQTAILGNSAINFDKVESAQTTNYIDALEYKLNVNTFSYNKNTGLMKFSGDGHIGTDATSKLNISAYSIIAEFNYDTLKVGNVSALVTGDIITSSLRKFTGSLLFDGQNSDNSKIDGILLGINGEPKITGLIKTSLNSTDISTWLSDNNSNSNVSLENIGDQSYFMEVNISKDVTDISTNMLVKRDDTKDTWTYVLKDLNVKDDKGSLSASNIYFEQIGSSTIVDTIEKIAVSGLSLDAGLDSLINLGWDVASDFNSIGIENLKVIMKPSSGDVIVKSTIHTTNSGATMIADMNSTYDYASTHLSSKGDFSTTVNVVNNVNTYSNKFSVDGEIKVDNLYNYNYALEYTDAAQYILFTRDDSNYQMGFVMRADGIKGGDSYGVLANFYMDETYSTLNRLELTDTSKNPLGLFDKATDPLQINYADGVKEYLYLY